MAEDIMELIIYKQWETTDCTTVHTYTKELPEFTEMLVQKN